MPDTRIQRPPPSPEPEPVPASGSVECVILAGGLSSRMGHDKARLRLAGRSLLAWTREAPNALGIPVRVQRRDAVPRCGPIGGILTALIEARARMVLFLACDMPLVEPQFLRRFVDSLKAGGRAAFAEHDGWVGFPCAIRRDCAPAIRRLIDDGRFSLQDVATTLNGSRLRLRPAEAAQCLNANTPAALPKLRALLLERRRSARSSERRGRREG